MSDEKILAFAPPGLNDPPAPKVPARPLTRGERLVGVSFNPSGDFAVRLAKHRAARTIDQLGNLPIATTMYGPPGQQQLPIVDMDHKQVIEEAIRRQIDAQMWAVKALTWGK